MIVFGPVWALLHGIKRRAVDIMKLAAFNGSPAGENGSTNCKILAILSLAEMCIA